MAALLLSWGAGAQADPMAWVAVDGAPNVADNTTYGDVNYSYRIGKYEVTNGQYRDFLNAKAAVGDTDTLYNTGMAGTYGGISRTGSGTELVPWVYSAKTNWSNRPVNYVSFWDAARFANWMHNGQGSGDTETGAYINIGNQTTFARQDGALFFIPTEDEWYKAAYYDPLDYDPDGAGGAAPGPGYWDYPTQSNTAPSHHLTDPDPGNNATFYDSGYTIGSPYYSTEVGAHENSASAYGTFDQGGNLWEWNETVLYTNSRGIRGGSWDYSAGALSASSRNNSNPSDEYGSVGFRLAGSPEMAAVPEPATVSFFACIAVGAMLRRRRRQA